MMKCQSLKKQNGEMEDDIDVSSFKQDDKAAMVLGAKKFDEPTNRYTKVLTDSILYDDIFIF